MFCDEQVLEQILKNKVKSTAHMWDSEWFIQHKRIQITSLSSNLLYIAKPNLYDINISK